MKNVIIFAFFLFFCLGCEKDDFNVNNPDVEQFVQQLKKGTYDSYEFGENGEKLWTIMPNFTKKHIPLLIHLAKDTSLVSPCHHFPVNPISSIPPYRIDDNRECIMIGEYLLWCVEGIIENKDFASLTPILINQSYSTEKRLNGENILEVRIIYQEWWEKNKQSENIHDFPLEETIYRWR